MSEAFLSANLDLAAIKAEYRAKGFIRIDNILTPEVAEQAHQCLVNQVPWKLAYRDGTNAVTMGVPEYQKQTPQQQQQQYQKILQQAAREFQYMYMHFSLLNAYKADAYPQLYLHKLVAYLSGGEFLAFLKDISGNEDARCVDVLAARYNPGQFLMDHDDYQDTDRRVAFVFNLSKDWKVDWGGLLHFMNRQGEIIDTHVPMFNSLTMFNVPAPHCVTTVSAFAPQPRVSVTGWSLARDTAN